MLPSVGPADEHQPLETTMFQVYLLLQKYERMLCMNKNQRLKELEVKIEKLRKEMEDRMDTGDVENTLIISQELDVLITEHVKIKELPKLRIIENSRIKALSDLLDSLILKKLAKKSYDWLASKEYSVKQALC